MSVSADGFVRTGTIRARKSPTQRKIPQVFNDGGKSLTRYAGERNCCTVISLATSLELPFEQAHDIMAWTGRLPNRGAWTVRLMSWLSEFFEPVRTPAANENRRYCTIGTFIDLYPTGTYYVQVKGHALVVKDGVVNDVVYPWNPVKAKTRVKSAYRIRKLSAR